MRDILLSDDLTMVNFEGTLTTEAATPTRRTMSSSSPRSQLCGDAARGRCGYGVAGKQPCAGLGESGLEETKETLLAAGIPYASEDEPAILTVKGVKIGSLAYQTVWRGA